MLFVRRVLFILFLSLGASAGDLKLGQMKSGWRYFHLTKRLGEIHAFEKVNDKQTRAFLRREIDVVLNNDSKKRMEILKRKCNQYKKQAKVHIDSKNGFCSYTLKIGKKPSTQYLFASKRKSKKVKNSFYWNLLTIPNANKNEENDNFVVNLKRRLDEI